LVDRSHADPPEQEADDGRDRGRERIVGDGAERLADEAGRLSREVLVVDEALRYGVRVASGRVDETHRRQQERSHRQEEVERCCRT
jgi:hypothetical protein